MKSKLCWILYRNTAPQLSLSPIAPRITLVSDQHWSSFDRNVAGKKTCMMPRYFKLSPRDITLLPGAWKIQFLLKEGIIVCCSRNLHCTELDRMVGTCRGRLGRLIEVTLIARYRRWSAVQ